MKKFVSLILAAAMLMCCAIAEIPTNEVTIQPSYEGVWAQVDQEVGLIVYVPADWNEYELDETDIENGYMFCYGSDEIQLCTMLAASDIETMYAELSASEDYTGFIVLTINGNTWFCFSSADDTLNVAVMNYAEGAVLVLEFYTVEPMGDSSLPAEILGTLTTVEALEAAAQQ